MKIKTKLLSAFLVTTLLPVLIVSLITVNNVMEQAESRFLQTSTTDISIVDQSFTNFFDLIGNNVSFMADLDAVTDTDAGTLSTYFGAGRKPSEVAIQNGGREEAIFKVFSAIGENNPMLGYVYMGDKDGGYLEWPGTADYGDWDPRSRPWFDIGRDANFNVVRRDGYYWEPDDAVYVTVLKGFRNSQNQFEGVVAIDVSLKSLTEMVQQIKLGETGYLMIVEGNGNILVDAGNPENNFQSLAKLDANYFGRIDETDSGLIDVEINGVEYIANIYQSQELGWKFVGLMEKDEIFASAWKIGMTTLIVSGVLVVMFGIAGVFIAKRIVTPINSVKDNLKTIAEGQGDLTTRIPVTSNDEAGELAQWFNQFIESTQNMIRDIKSTALDMDRVSSDTNAKSQDLSTSAAEQLGAIEQIVTAVTEMAAAASEVAKNCVDTASVSENGLDSTKSGKEIINRSATSVEGLGQSIKSSNSVILELEQETGNINNILSTIQDIAEQTNLLALNAAIEAARAGEQGRGFAVVADEVRNLAKRTQTSTEEINKILGQLISRTQDVSATMSRSARESEAAVEITGQVLHAFDAIEESVEKIRDMTTQTASAAEEQHLVTEDINQNIVTINDSANQVTGVSQEVASLCSQQAELNTQLSTLVARFRTD